MTTPVSPVCSATSSSIFNDMREPSPAELSVLGAYRTAMAAYEILPQGAVFTGIQWRCDGVAEARVEFRVFDREANQWIVSTKDLKFVTKLQEPPPDASKYVNIELDARTGKAGRFDAEALEAIPELAHFVTEARERRETFLNDATDGVHLDVGVIGSAPLSATGFAGVGAAGTLSYALDKSTSFGVRVASLGPVGSGKQGMARVEGVVRQRVTGSTLGSGTGVVASVGADGRDPSLSLGYFAAVSTLSDRDSSPSVRFSLDVRASGVQSDGTPKRAQAGLSVEIDVPVP